MAEPKIENLKLLIAKMEQDIARKDALINQYEATDKARREALDHYAKVAKENADRTLKWIISELEDFIERLEEERDW